MKHVSCVFGNMSVRTEPFFRKQNTGKVVQIDLWKQVKVKYITFNHVCDSESNSSAHEQLCVMLEVSWSYA